LTRRLLRRLALHLLCGFPRTALGFGACLGSGARTRISFASGSGFGLDQRAFRLLRLFERLLSARPPLLSLSLQFRP
jgi:hypothetical protein